MNQKNRGFIGFLKANGFYVVLVICVVAAGVSSYLAVDTLITQFSAEPENTPFSTPPTVSSQPVDNPQSDVPISSYVAPSSSEADTDESEEEAMASDDSSNKEESEPTVESQPLSEVVEEAVTTPTQAEQTVAPPTPDSETPVTEPPSFVMPVSGEIIVPFSDDELVYNETMEDWRTHNGVDIAAALDTPVMAAVTGKVTKVYLDDMWGGVVEITSDDVVIKYAGLNAEMAVTVGQDVTAGSAIGRVGELPCELATPSHIHVEAMRGKDLFAFTELSD